MDFKRPDTKYDFPKDKPSPFDINSNGQYYVYADGFSNLTDNLNDFSIDNLSNNIPTGYKAIVLCQRLRIINNGKILMNWNYDKPESVYDKDIIGKYFINSNTQLQFFVPSWNQKIDTYAIPKPNSDMISIYSTLWGNLDESISFSIELSLKEKNALLISQVVRYDNWH